ncbi:MAG: WecB/TagA/CpsF family glycosyltransferase [Leptospiraceae bacterium]|jgi:N-acetylglucosaminyldiphosphoundecaprenol N-acetyl-beta-D-mannosaminyltransferase|nr:WecB/TagA/CpsF family glycosyltransferase [Leptospiraceae bacterium]
MKDPKEITHNSSKEERDYVLEYQNVDITSRDKISILGVDIDNMTRDEAIANILDFHKKKESFHHILFIDPIRLMSMRPGKKLNRIARKASLVLAEGGGLEWAADQLGFKLKERISVISLMMDLIRYSEKKELTLFFLGSKEDIIERLFFNLIRHFPEIRIVGRHSGHLNDARELMVKEAIRKTNPDIIFIGMDFPRQEVWIENNTGYFGNSIVIGAWGNLDTLSGQVKKAPDYFQLRGLTWLWRIFARPYRVDKFYHMIQFFFTVKLENWKMKREAKRKAAETNSAE